MAFLHPHIDYIKEMIEERKISQLDAVYFLNQNGIKCSERTLRRFCSDYGISKNHKVSHDDLKNLCSSAVDEVNFICFN